MHAMITVGQNSSSPVLDYKMISNWDESESSDVALNSWSDLNYPVSTGLNRRVVLRIQGRWSNPSRRLPLRSVQMR